MQKQKTNARKNKSPSEERRCSMIVNSKRLPL